MCSLRVARQTRGWMKYMHKMRRRKDEEDTYVLIKLFENLRYLWCGNVGVLKWKLNKNVLKFFFYKIVDV